MNTLGYQPMLSYNVAIGATSAQSPAVSTSSGQVRLFSDGDCWVKTGSNPTADTTTSVRMSAGVPEYFVVPAGQKIAVIQAFGAGNLNITEMSR